MPKKKKGLGLGSSIAIGVGLGASVNKGVKKVMTPTKPGGWADAMRRRAKRGKGLFS